MSKFYSAAMTMAFAVAIVLAANHAEDNAPSSTTRAPSSLKKEMVLGNVEAPLHRHTEKVSGPVETSIELTGARPEKAGDVFVLRGLISSSMPLDMVDFKWSLPEDVELINGELSGQIAALAPGKTAEVVLTLKSKTGENHQVHLMASSHSGETRFGQVSQYNTLLEPVLDMSRKEAMQKAADEAAGKPAQFKVFH